MTSPCSWPGDCPAWASWSARIASRRGSWAVAHLRPDVVLLDDGFQQRRLLKDVEIVCLDARAPWGPGGLFPRGTLRESPSALARAHLVVATRAAGRRDLDPLLGEIHRHAGPAPCLAADYAVEGVEDLASGARHAGAALRGRAVLAFAGIAAPERLAETLAAHGATVRDLVAFPDHHAYEPRDLVAILGRARAVGADLLVTTEKDGVRLRGPGALGPWSPPALRGAAPPVVWALSVRLAPLGSPEAWRAELRARVEAAARGAGERTMKTRLIPRDAVQRVLVRLPNWLGDTVMALPLLRSLRRAVPEAELWCLGPWAPTILESEPGITRRLLLPVTAGARLAQARRLREARFDLALIVPNSFETALAGWLSGARWRVGYAADGRKRLLTHALRRDAGPAHEVTTYLRLLRPLGVDEASGTPRLAIDPARRAEARRLMADAGLTSGHLRVALQLGAAFGASKLWPPDRVGVLAARLEARGVDTVLLGRETKELEEAVRAAAGVPLRSLVGRDRPALLAALMAEFDALVAADSGPAHVAAAVGVPTVTLFGPTDPRLTAPLGAEQRAIWRQPVCSPCFLRECPIDHRCLRAIEVDEVEAAVVAALARRS